MVKIDGGKDMKTNREFNAKELMEKVIAYRSSLFSEFEVDGDIYTVYVRGQKPIMIIDENAEWKAEIIKNDKTLVREFSHLKKDGMIEVLNDFAKMVEEINWAL